MRGLGTATGAARSFGGCRPDWGWGFLAVVIALAGNSQMASCSASLPLTGAWRLRPTATGGRRCAHLAIVPNVGWAGMGWDGRTRTQVVCRRSNRPRGWVDETRRARHRRSSENERHFRAMESEVTNRREISSRDEVLCYDDSHAPFCAKHHLPSRSCSERAGWGDSPTGPESKLGLLVWLGLFSGITTSEFHNTLLCKGYVWDADSAFPIQILP